MSKKSRFKRLLRQQSGQETHKEEEKKDAREQPEEIKHNSSLARLYDKHYKKLLIIPFGMLIVALAVLGLNFLEKGEFFSKAVDIKGGVSLSIPTEEANLDEIQSVLFSNFPERDINLRTLSAAGKQTGIILDIDIDLNDEANIDKLIGILRTELNLPLNQGQYTLTGIGSSLGKSFFRETIVAMIIAFFFMSIIVFIYFRTPIPCLAVVLAALSDIIVTLAIIDLMGVRLSTAGIAAFLMLIGYSVDTDILLSTRVLKRKEGTIMDRIINAMKTGMTMTITTLVAVAIALFFTQSEVLQQIMLVILIGLLVDIINTWIQNAGILKWYLEKHGAK